MMNPEVWISVQMECEMTMYSWGTTLLFELRIQLSRRIWKGLGKTVPKPLRYWNSKKNKVSPIHCSCLYWIVFSDHFKTRYHFCLNSECWTLNESSQQRGVHRDQRRILHMAAFGPNLFCNWKPKFVFSPPSSARPRQRHSALRSKCCPPPNLTLITMSATCTWRFSATEWGNGGSFSEEFLHRSSLALY